MTMEIHHGRHHKAYVDNLNKALEGQSSLQNLPIDKLLREISKVPENIRQAVLNNGGGHANHSMFWEIMGPRAGGQPSGPLAEEINKLSGDFATFQQQLKQAAVGRFGSGWAWLVLAGGKLQIVSTPNQDSPYMNGQIPIMGVDVWEHAYYLKYQNKRPDYVDAWWNLVNWNAVAERFTKAKSGKL
jgi:Fe-Mn family superoxide dismutase